MWLVTAPLVAEEPARPEFSEVVQVVETHFAAVDDYAEGDLISAQQVTEALTKIEETGWQVPDAQDLVGRALPESNFLVRQMSTRKGRRFIRKVGKSAGGYSQLDRLSTTTDGKKHIRFLIGKKDGHLLIKYLATTNGGRRVGRQLARVPRGVNLNKPTERIYTVEQLLAEFKTAYAAPQDR